MKIGSFEFEYPVVQAALSGYSDSAMRRIARRCGAPYAIAEVVLDKLVVQGGRKQRRHMRLEDDDHPVGGQLMGSEPEQFSAAARELCEVGFDIIDINFGCPVPKVLGRCRGGFHLSNPVTALDIVARVREAVPIHIPVTLKMRRGVDDTQESRDHFFTILDGAFALGVDAVTVHGRTVVQRYDGPSRWEFLKEVKLHVGDRTILGSGDLFTPQDIMDMIEQTGVDGVTVARGAIGNPWIFQQTRALWDGLTPIPAPVVSEQRRIIELHYAWAMDLYGPERGCRMMRKFGIKYARLHPSPIEVRDAFVSVSRESQWREVLDTWYRQPISEGVC